MNYPENISVLDAVKLDQLAINTIRFLSVDAVQKANSGHPGLPLGAAPMAYALWNRFLRHNPAHPFWFDRDRFILSAGHGSMLLYSLLHLTGYNVPLEQIKQFRQWGSITPGHPEHFMTPGVETTTGPLGQGFANGVGMAMAEAYLAAKFNRPGFEIVNHYTYGIVSDGDLMEGVAAEAASLAGHLKLGKLIYLFDNNHISLAASTQLTFTEDHEIRFRAYGWHTQVVDDGNDLEAIHNAIFNAQNEKDRPSLILVRTHIGFGSPNKQDTFSAHGSPLGEDEVNLTKQNLGWPIEPTFYVPSEAAQHLLKAVEKGKDAENSWNEMISAYEEHEPALAGELHQIMKKELPGDWDKAIPEFPADQKGMATRVASGKIMNAFFKNLPGFMGGSADLNPSTNTVLKDAGDFESSLMKTGDIQGSSGGDWSYSGRNIHFGVREHAMGAILNGLGTHGGIIPYGATFLTFSDYMRPAIRLAALMKAHVIYVFTHDSIAMGEDGPTHQPIEQIASLRAIPRLFVVRPCDANETAFAWRVAVETSDRPVALILTRQNVPVLDRSVLASADGLRRGAYVLSDCRENPQLIFIATGSEVALVLEAQKKLLEQNVMTRVVSMPCWELFEKQTREYKESVLPSQVKARLAVEAGTTFGWNRYTGDQGQVIGIDHFGASAPGPVVMREFGFTVENIISHALSLIGNVR